MRALALIPVCLTLVADAPTRPCAVQGRVVDAQGKGIPGAAVALVKLGASEVPALRALTDAQGRYRLKAEKGAYALTVTHPGWNAAYLKKVELAASVVTLPPTALAEGGVPLEGRVAAARDLGSYHLALARVSEDDGDVFLVPVHRGRFKVRLPEGTYRWLAQGGILLDESLIQVVKGAAPLRVVLDAQPRKAPESVRQWVRAHAIPLKGVEAGQGFADMAPLARVIGKARVVSLGEATHGTREFFQLKHRMLEYLVSEQGFTAFAIEANLPECEALNAYVLTGKGDPRKGLDGIYFWTWNTEEVLALVEWMRAWNADPTHARKVRFYGFDNQTATVAYKKVKAQLDAEDPNLAAWMEKELGALSLAPSPAASDPAKVKALAEAAAELGRRLDAKAGFDPFLRRCARILEQKVAIDAGGSAARDVGMAENVQWILQQEGPAGRVVLWAHNAHVGKSRAFGQTWMGGHLSKALGETMVVFGFALRDGSFQAVDAAPNGRGLRDFTLKGLPGATLDEALASAKAPALALDLRDLPKAGPVRAWFDASQGTFQTGAVFREGAEARYTAALRVVQAYDALLFVAHTTAARPLHARSVKPTTTTPAPAPTNLGFEEGVVQDPPQGWFSTPGMKDYAQALKTDGAHEGGRWLEMRAAAEATEQAWGTVMQTVDATPYRGKRVRLRGWARAADGARATYWLRIDRPDHGQGFFDNAMDRAVTQDAWTELVIEGTVSEDALTLNFGAMVVGNGRAGFDDVKLEVLN